MTRRRERATIAALCALALWLLARWGFVLGWRMWTGALVAAERRRDLNLAGGSR